MEVVIKKKNLTAIKCRPTFYIVNTLVDAGAPIEILRKSLVDTSDYLIEKDFKITGKITFSEMSNGDLHYFFD